MSGAMPTSIHSRGEIDRTGPLPVWLDPGMLEISLKSARLVPQGDELPLTADGDRLRFEVPGLGVHQTVVLE